MARILIKKHTVNKNVQDCSDDELVYSSDWNNWKVFKDSDTDGAPDLTIPANDDNGNYGYVDIVHGLDYVPAAEFWIKDGTIIHAIPGCDPDVNYNFDVYIDSNKVRVTGRDSNYVGAKTVSVYYKIYYERIDQ